MAISRSLPLLRPHLLRMCRTSPTTAGAMPLNVAKVSYSSMSQIVSQSSNASQFQADHPPTSHHDTNLKVVGHDSIQVSFLGGLRDPQQDHSSSTIMMTWSGEQLVEATEESMQLLQDAIAYTSPTFRVLDGFEMRQGALCILNQSER